MMRRAGRRAAQRAARLDIPYDRARLHHGRLEAVTPADRGHLEMKRCVPRVAAVVDQGFRRLMLAANDRELLGPRMGLAEVGAQPALSVVNLQHVSSPG